MGRKLVGRDDHPSQSGGQPSCPGATAHLASIQLQIGYAVKRDMPQLTGPEVERLYERGRAWLARGSLGG